MTASVVKLDRLYYRSQLASAIVSHLQGLAVFHGDFQDVDDVEYLTRQDIPRYKVRSKMSIDPSRWMINVHAYHRAHCHL